MRTGIIRDLAVGCHPGGADAWAWQDVLVPGMSVGAPPDEFNQRGQDWNQPPWHPQRLAAQGYAPLAGLIGAGLRHAGGLRVDHVMGLLRLWWVPAGMPPDQGTYVRYDHEAMVGVLAGQAAAAGALAIGEDLGTVDPWIRDYLAGQGVLGTSMLWFERGPDGAPLPPGKWRRNCLAMVGTHDVPPVAAFVTGEQVELRSRLGLLTRPYQAERAEAERRRGRLAGRAGRRGPAGRRAAAQPGRVHRGLLRAPGPHPGPAGRRVAGRRGRATGARRTCPAPRPSTRTGGSRYATARAGRSPWRTWPTAGTSARWPGRSAARAERAVSPAWPVPLLAAQRPAHAVLALGEQPAQRGGRVGPRDVLVGQPQGPLADLGQRVGVAGEVLRHVAAPARPHRRRPRRSNLAAYGASSSGLVRVLEPVDAWRGTWRSAACRW